MSHVVIIYSKFDRCPEYARPTLQESVNTDFKKLYPDLKGIIFWSCMEDFPVTLANKMYDFAKTTPKVQLSFTEAEFAQGFKLMEQSDKMMMLDRNKLDKEIPEVASQFIDYLKDNKTESNFDDLV